MPIVPKAKRQFQQWMALATCTAVFLSSNWFRATQVHYPVSFFLLGFTVLFTLFLAQSLPARRKTFVLITLFSLFCSYLVIKFPDRSLWQQTPEETQLINQRRSYYPVKIGKVYQNKVSQALFKLERNLFNSLDINLYFFATHPRERAGIAEFEKFSFLLLPFFVIGLIQAVKAKPLLVILALLIASTSATLLNPAAKFGPLPFLPLVSSLISVGILKSVKVI